MSALGTVVILGAYLESWMGEFLTFLLEANAGLMHAVTANVSASSVAEWIETILNVKAFPDKLSPEIKELLDEVRRLRGERNALVHGLWAFNDDGAATVQTIRLSRSPVVNDLVVTFSDLQELAIAIGEAKEALKALGERLGFPPSPE